MTSEEDEYFGLAFPIVIMPHWFSPKACRGELLGFGAIPMIREYPITFRTFAVALLTIQLGFTKLVMGKFMRDAAVIYCSTRSRWTSPLTSCGRSQGKTC